MQNYHNKLVVGTAQFGQDYGVTNNNGQVAIDEAFKILKKARSYNALSVDTASSYGDSESILGSIGVSDLEIITKLPSAKTRKSKLLDFYEESIKTSINNLKVKSVDTVLLHRPEELLGSSGDEIYKALCALKEKEYTKNIGISIYAPDILKPITDKFRFDSVQAPVNIFDRRLLSSGWLKKLRDMDISVMARSIFLQGILLSSIENLPLYFHKWTKVFENWHAYCKNNNLSLLETAVQYIVQIPEIDKIIIGIENEKQLSEILKSLKKYNLTNADHLSVDDVNLICPTNWKL